MDFNEFYKTRCERVETFLEKKLPEDNNTLCKAMRYATLNGGKRLRPMLVYCTGESLGANVSDLDHIAAAVEMIHSYSLVHDDLPAMDDDDLRRGKPSTHKAYDEATAIITGDALQCLAFEVMSSQDFTVTPRRQLDIIEQLSKACGAKGMALGQALDMQPEEIKSVEMFETIHLHKTGALIESSVVFGALAAEDSEDSKIVVLTQFGRKLGLAYQIQDDVLDLESSTEVLGKPVLSDVKNDKATYPVLVGIENAKQEAQNLYKQALILLEKIQMQDSVLSDAVQFMMARDS
jgi:farnesyl diphosphate synthase